MTKSIDRVADGLGIQLNARERHLVEVAIAFDSPAIRFTSSNGKNAASPVTLVVREFDRLRRLERKREQRAHLYNTMLVLGSLVTLGLAVAAAVVFVMVGGLSWL